MDNYKNYEELPCYTMFKRKDFPTIRIGKRVLVSRDRSWNGWKSRQRRYKS